MFRQAMPGTGSPTVSLTSPSMKVVISFSDAQIKEMTCCRLWPDVGRFTLRISMIGSTSVASRRGSLSARLLLQQT